jgi:tetratricopeptide (TPR) repeat protein
LSLTQDNGHRYDAYSSRAIAHANKGDFASAIADADAAIGIYDFPSSYVDRAKIYEMKGDYGSAVNDYSVAINAQQKVTRKAAKSGVSAYTYVDEQEELFGLYRGRAELYIQARSWDKAIADCKAMIGMFKAGATPAVAAIYRVLAFIYENGKGDKKRADEYTQKAQAIDSQIKK